MLNSHNWNVTLDEQPCLKYDHVQSSHFWIITSAEKPRLNYHLCWTALFNYHLCLGATFELLPLMSSHVWIMTMCRAAMFHYHLCWTAILIITCVGQPCLNYYPGWADMFKICPSAEQPFLNNQLFWAAMFELSPVLSSYVWITTCLDSLCLGRFSLITKLDNVSDNPIYSWHAERTASGRMICMQIGPSVCIYWIIHENVSGRRQEMLDLRHVYYSAEHTNPDITSKFCLNLLCTTGVLPHAFKQEVRGKHNV